ncbi:MAG: hypothetical protein QOD75_2417 [Blastocatellia bacterium]|jgi:prefoldin subunit 5|nr:hypothetical protein [Blastocatellia bacterium]
MAEMLDGIYDSLGNTLSVLLTSDKSVARLKALVDALTVARENKASAEEVKETITRHVPELQKFADAVPKTPLGLNEYIKTICLIITTLIAAYAFLCKKSDVTQEQISKQVEREVSNAIETLQPKPKAVEQPDTANRHERRAQAKRARHR